MTKLIVVAAFFVTAGISMGAQALENTRWRLVELAGKPVNVAVERQRPHIRLVENSRVEGFGGCNSLHGRYKVAGDHLNFRNSSRRSGRARTSR